LAFVTLSLTLGFLPAIAALLAGSWLDGRGNKAFDLLIQGQGEEAEKLALEEVARELPGPVADEYLTAAAIGQALQGDLKKTEATLAKREAPVTQLQGLRGDFHRLIGAVLLADLGAAKLGLEVAGDINPRQEDAGLCLTHVRLNLSAGRYRKAQEILEVVLERFTSPAVRRDTQAQFLRLARETWDPEIEHLLPGFDPQDPREAEIQLSCRLFLAEIQARPRDAEMLSQKLMQLRCQQLEVEFPEDFFLWRDSLKSAQLHAADCSPEDQEALLERIAPVRDGLPETEQENIEGGYLEAWLEMNLALSRGQSRQALLEGEEDRVMLFSGAVLATSRILILASILGDPGAAAQELLRLRNAFPEAPGLLAASAALRLLANRSLDAQDAFTLKRARYAARLFPPEIARILEDLPVA
jgi:hypothetical protein